ncbi:MAG: NAD/NADP octopine/nopaline dehydrogenase family protein [Paludibacteraceae bacterium]|nr:NAD/NADP octopine/nopaline dehydrogenase family protein [Paludibacteraceae bacterium]
MKRICICGGGSLGHVCAGVLSSQSDVNVNVFTRSPEKWTRQLIVKDLNGKVYEGNIKVISDNPQEVLEACDIILLCLPGYAIENTLEIIKPYIGESVVGSIVCSTGFFFFAHRILGERTRLFGFQRVPFIARLEEYGHSANLLGYKQQLFIAHENISDVESFRSFVERLWLTPVKLLSSYYEASLTNSNPILHTGRLYDMWKDWNGELYDHNILFYKEWTIESSQILIDMDAEFMRLLDVLPVAKNAIPSLLEYYESHDAESLCRKIRNIPAFENITSPMKQVKGGWIPDFESRYFVEDFPYGLYFIKTLAEEKGIDTPVINRVYEWGMSVCNKKRS